MGKVVPLKAKAVRPVAVTGKPIRRNGAWILWMGTEGRKPKGHPPLTFGPRGGVRLAVNQVWVESHGSRLWVIRSIRKGSSHPSYPHLVELIPYYRGQYVQVLAEMTFRQTMKVWEAAIQFRSELDGKLHHAAKFDPQSPFSGVESARVYFGLDRFGNRVGGLSNLLKIARVVVSGRILKW